LHRALVKRIQESFSAKIIALVAASVLVTSFVVGLVTVRSTSEFLSKKTREKFPSVLASTESRLRIWYREQLSTLDQLGHGRVLQDNLAAVLTARDSESADSTGITQVRKYYELVQQRFPQFNHLLLLDSEGHLLAQSRGHQPAYIGQLAHEIAEARNQIRISGLIGDPVESGEKVPGVLSVQWLLVPIMDEESVRAWMVGEIGMAAIRGVLADGGLSSGADIYLLDRYGRFVTQPWTAEEDMYGQVAMGVPTRETGHAVVEKRENFRGQVTFTSKVYFEQCGWWIVYEEDYRSAMAPVIQAQRRVWIAVLIIGAIAILVGLRIAQSILRPIRNLSVGAKRINEGLVGVKIEPGPNDEIGMLIETFNEMAQKISLSAAELQYKNSILNTKNDELEVMNVRLEKLSVTDGLTGLFNHRHFWNLLNTELTRVGLYQGDLALILIDLDDFKQVNDHFGHAVGDQLLVAVSRILTETARETDIVARYGGEEFALLLPDTNQAGVEKVSEKLLRSVESLRFKVPETDITIKVTVSIGVSVYHGDRRAFFNKADQALYKSKSAGKNRVHYALHA